MRTIISLFIVITILTSAVVGGAVYYWQLTEINNLLNQNQIVTDQLNKQIQGLQQQLADLQANTNTQADNTNNQPVLSIEDWVTMVENDFGISFKYPRNYFISGNPDSKTPLLKIASPNFSSELVGQPLLAVIKGNAFFLEEIIYQGNFDLDKMIEDRLSKNQMAVPDQKQLPKEIIGNFEFALYTVNGYDEALFYNANDKRGWKVVSESENPVADHTQFLEFLNSIKDVENVSDQVWQTYTNSEYKFSLQYPQGDEFTMTPIATAASPVYVIKDQVQDHNMLIQIWDNPQSLELFDWMTSLPSDPLPQDAPRDINYYIDTSTIDMQPALRIWTGGTSNWDQPGECFQACPRIEIYFTRYNKAFKIISNESLTPEAQAEFDKMILSLKFL